MKALIFLLQIPESIMSRFEIFMAYSYFQYTVGVTEPIYRSLIIIRVELYRDTRSDSG